MFGVFHHCVDLFKSFAASGALAILCSATIFIVAFAAALVRAAVEMEVYRIVSVRFHFRHFLLRRQGFLRRMIIGYGRAAARFLLTLVLGFVVAALGASFLQQVLGWNSKTPSGPFALLLSLPALLVFTALLAVVIFGAEGDRTFPTLSAVVDGIARDLVEILKGAGAGESTASPERMREFANKWAVLSGFTPSPVVPAPETSRIQELLDTGSTVINRDFPEKMVSDGVGVVFGFLIGGGGTALKSALIVFPALAISTGLRIHMLRVLIALRRHYEEFVEALHARFAELDEVAPAPTEIKIPNEIALPLRAHQLRAILGIDTLSDELLKTVAEDLSGQIVKKVSIEQTASLSQKDRDIVFRLVAAEEHDALLRFVQLKIPNYRRRAAATLRAMVNTDQNATAQILRELPKRRSAHSGPT